MSISKNAVAIVVLFLGYFGVDVTDNAVLEFIGNALSVIAFLTMIYHQVKERPETEGFFFKKW
jgi:uncharacterized membrane protein